MTDIKVPGEEAAKVAPVEEVPIVEKAPKAKKAPKDEIPSDKPIRWTGHGNHEV